MYELPEDLASAPLRTTRRGHFWIAGEIVDSPAGTVMRAPMFVQWEAPEAITRERPVILVHGGGGQGTDYTGTPDGRPGWLDRFVDAGYLTYVVDRPGHGRSWFHPGVVGEPGPQFTFEAANGLFSTPIPGHDRKVWGETPGEPVLDQLVSGMGYLPMDFAESHRMDADRMARLLDRTGPAIVVTHSAGAPAGWLAADARPEAVAALVAIEPIGPAFSVTPGIGGLTWGLTAWPMTLEPMPADPADFERDPAAYRAPALAGFPTLVVVADKSPFTGFEEGVADFVNTIGGRAEFMNLGDHGVTGNGHGMMLESNSDDAVRPILEWIERAV